MKWYPSSYSGGGTENKTVTFDPAEKRENIKSGEKHKTIFGKIARWFADLKTVAFTGNYSDLSGKPSSLPASDVNTWAKAANKPSYNWSEIGGKPSAYPPASHTHAQTQVTGLQEALNNKVNKAGDTCTGRINLRQGSTVADLEVAAQPNADVGTTWLRYARFTVKQPYIGDEQVVMQYRLGFRFKPLRLGFTFEHTGNTDPGSIIDYSFTDYAAFDTNSIHYPAINCASWSPHCANINPHLFIHHAGTSVYDLYVRTEITWPSIHILYLRMPQGIEVEWYTGAGVNKIRAIPTSGVLLQIKYASADGPLFGMESRIAALEAKVK